MNKPDLLDRDGDWEIKVSIYRNGRRVAFADAAGDDFEFTAYTIMNALERREVTIK